MPVGIFIPFGYESKNKLLTDIPVLPLPPALGKCRCGSRSQTTSACCCRPVCRAAAVGVGHAGGRRRSSQQRARSAGDRPDRQRPFRDADALLATAPAATDEAFQRERMRRIRLDFALDESAARTPYGAAFRSDRRGICALGPTRPDRASRYRWRALVLQARTLEPVPAQRRSTRASPRGCTDAGPQRATAHHAGVVAAAEQGGQGVGSAAAL